MRYFDGSKYSGTCYHGDWKYALLEYGKGMDESGESRKRHLQQALQILNNVPDNDSVPGVTASDVGERTELIREISRNM